MRVWNAVTIAIIGLLIASRGLDYSADRFSYAAHVGLPILKMIGKQSCLEGELHHDPTGIQDYKS